jgi:outer membrane protein
MGANIRKNRFLLFQRISRACRVTALLAATCVAATGGDAPVAQPGVRTVTIDEAVVLALRQNPDILRAIQEIERTRGLVIEVRAEALPQINLNANYSQQDRNLIEGSGNRNSSGPLEITLPPPEDRPDAEPQKIVIGGEPGGDGFSAPDKSWRVAIEGRQLLYSGGQVAAASRAARFTQESSYYALRDTIDSVISAVRQQFYQVLLNRALITVQEESINLLQTELTDQQNRFEAGTVPRFNVLRAEVELANARPELIRARNAYFTSKLRLARTLGLPFDASPGNAPVDVKGGLTVHDRPIDLAASLDWARANRAFLKVQRQNILIEVEQIRIAAAGYQPRIEANGGYEARSSGISDDLRDSVDGWFFGVQGNWAIFDGFATYGRVKQARARLESAKVTYEDSVRQVDLEVENAFARLNEARELIASQRKAVEQANEALRLARERLTAGAGTQLELLDARVALTRARVTELQARYDFNVALAEFERVTATETQYAEMFDDPLTRKHRKVKRAEPATSPTKATH